MNLLTQIFFGVLIFFAVSLSTPLYAAEINFTVVPNDVRGDTATIVAVYVDPEGASLNALEGTIGFLGPAADDLSLVVIETGDSALSLWQLDPIYLAEDKVIRFVGGATESIEQKRLLFRIRIFSPKSGDLTMAWLNGSAHADDGLGTTVNISSRSLAIALMQSEPNLINPSSADSRPPYFDTVYMTYDPESYGGKKFITFHATDDLSGIARYEVIERDVLSTVQDGVYVLRDQVNEIPITIVAYDKAGNSISIKVPFVSTWVYWLAVCTALSVLIAVLVYRSMRRTKIKIGYPH